ncbi:protein FAM198B isoform X2 [Cynoglossus semilaevis]|uniref:Golgi associated kinase 1B n=1 Tax=Cynoglossus semilaevis TaxID=244447 RepID=A0A3P8V0I1_CYNSE|nr:protein FAM198B isoform X2 [Cynoglossus semilaevis]
MGKPRLHRLCFSILRLSSSFWRCPLSKRTLIIATVCLFYLFFVVLYVGHSKQQRDRRTDLHKYGHTRGLDTNVALLNSADTLTDTNTVVPTRSNVVYITLRSKRMKPSNIRGTVRPKLRKKVRNNGIPTPAFTHEKFRTLERDAGQIQGNSAPRRAEEESRDIDYKPVDNNGAGWSKVSSIRIYSQRAPHWFSAQDVKAMRYLADGKILRLREVYRENSPSLLMFEGEASDSLSSNNHSVCTGQCGVIHSPVDTTQVFAFHLDRVLGLNRTLPAVSRKFRFIHDGQPCPVVLWDAILYPEGLAADGAKVRLTWGGYQRALKQKCWDKNISPKLDSGCSTIHHWEWSRVALFDFLLQIHNRLDPSCCGFRPRHEDQCVVLGRHADCGDQDSIQLTNIIHKTNNPRRLVFTHNKGFFDRNEDNLDFRLLEGITELPEQAVSVLRSGKLREKLLQSLFLDQTYWESQGGRHGIDKLIDVIEGRVRVLLTYINAHGIKVITMTL